jgi:hypothetical protein
LTKSFFNSKQSNTFTSELKITVMKNEITVTKVGYGTWKVKSVTPKGRVKTATTHNSQLIDRYNDLKICRERGYKAVLRQLDSLTS